MNCFSTIGPLFFNSKNKKKVLKNRKTVHVQCNNLSKTCAIGVKTKEMTKQQWRKYK